MNHWSNTGSEYTSQATSVIAMDMGKDERIYLQRIEAQD